MTCTELESAGDSLAKLRLCASGTHSLLAPVWSWSSLAAVQVSQRLFGFALRTVPRAQLLPR
jgi:hypothetical protein